MAIDFYKKEISAEKEAVKEATEKYNDLVATFILIGISSKKRGDKLKLIQEWNQKMQKFNANFAQKKVEDAYKKFAIEAGKEAKALQPDLNIKKKLSPAQLQELENLSAELESILNQRLNALVEQAKRLIIKEELAKLRELKLKMIDGNDKIVLPTGQQKTDIVFIDSKGRKIKMDAIMKVTVGDQIWDTINSSKRSVYLDYGFQWAEHISVVDDKTTIICLSLNHTIRDLKKDKIPPMHPNCRSRIRLLKSKNLNS